MQRTGEGGMGSPTGTENTASSFPLLGLAQGSVALHLQSTRREELGFYRPAPLLCQSLKSSEKLLNLVTSHLEPINKRTEEQCCVNGPIGCLSNSWDRGSEVLPAIVFSFLLSFSIFHRYRRKIYIYKTGSTLTKHLKRKLEPLLRSDNNTSIWHQKHPVQRYWLALLILVSVSHTYGFYWQ